MRIWVSAVRGVTMTIVWKAAWRSQERKQCSAESAKFRLTWSSIDLSPRWHSKSLFESWNVLFLLWISVQVLHIEELCDCLFCWAVTLQYKESVMQWILSLDILNLPHSPRRRQSNLRILPFRIWDTSLDIGTAFVGNMRTTMISTSGSSCGPVNASQTLHHSQKVSCPTRRALLHVVLQVTWEGVICDSFCRVSSPWLISVIQQYRFMSTWAAR